GSIHGRRTCVLLIQMGPGNIRREGQVLDRGPPSGETKLRNVVVGVAGGDTRTKGSLDRPDPAASAAQQTFRGVVVHDRRVSTVDAAVPVGIPVVGVATAEAPCLDQLLRTSQCENRVRSKPDSNAAVVSR